MAYRTELRTHEIGIRVALGAFASGFDEAGAATGNAADGNRLALGLALSFGLTRVIASLLYGVGIMTR